jgi:hypothetical protein
MPKLYQYNDETTALCERFNMTRNQANCWRAYCRRTGRDVWEREKMIPRKSHKPKTVPVVDGIERQYFCLSDGKWVEADGDMLRKYLGLGVKR